MDYKISIIMPIFNKEKYLERSITSIINQTIGFENIELILVDDGSCDRTPSIIEDYSNEYDNIIPIYLNKNSGTPGIPKNRGIYESTSPI